MKLSEILKVAKPYHYALGGSKSGMCEALMLSRDIGLLTDVQEEQAVVFCMDFVKSIHQKSLFLDSALKANNLPRDKNTLALIWGAVIDKLEEDGE